MKYRAFISYKHLSSTGFAERMELALKAYAKPLWQRPIAIFRDEKYLKPGINLPGMIADALDESEFLIYLASPHAAASTWVQDELSQWCGDPKRVSRLIIVLTEGSIDVDDATKTINWERTNALPCYLGSPWCIPRLRCRCQGPTTIRGPSGALGTTNSKKSATAEVVRIYTYGGPGG